jgi:transcriptional regulator with XRE-family HTH domain
MSIIKDVRLMMKFTQFEFAEMLSKSQQMLSNYERKKYQPNFHTCQRIVDLAKRYNVKLKVDDIANDYL